MEQQGYVELSGPTRHAFGGVPGGVPAAVPPDWRRELRAAVLSRVVPRLSDVGLAEGRVAGLAAPFAEAEVFGFSAMALAAPVPRLVDHVGALRAAGASAEAVLLDLLAPAARRLGDLWLEDRLSFLDVTAALGRLQGVLRALGPDFDGGGSGRRPGRSILLAPAAGEQHVFGLSMVAAFFRRAGWDVRFEPRIAFDDVLALVRAERFAVVGLSAAGDRPLSALPAQVEALRRASCAGNLVVLAGGPAFLHDPELGARVGVDAVARDAAEAVRVADAAADRMAAARARP